MGDIAGYSGVKFSSRLSLSLTKDSSIEDCVFDGFHSRESGGGAYVSGSFELVVSSCRFLNCVGGLA